MKRLKPKHIFYVYEHWRPDKDICFWVGKGHKRRAYEFKRNKHYDKVVAKLKQLGMCVEVRMVDSGLLEAEAHQLEVERIAFWRSQGIKLTNATDGGEGVSGYKHSKKTLELLSRIYKPTVADPKIRAKISATLTLFLVDPVVRAQRSETTAESWKDPKVRESRIKRQKEVFAKPAHKARRSEIMRLRMQPGTVFHKNAVDATIRRHRLKREAKAKAALVKPEGDD